MRDVLTRGGTAGGATEEQINALLELFAADGIVSWSDFTQEKAKGAAGKLDVAKVKAACCTVGMKLNAQGNIVASIASAFGDAPYGTCEALNVAAYDGNVEALRKLTKTYAGNNAVLNWQDGGGCSAAHWAANHGHAECLSLLLASGIDLSLRSASGQTALSMARHFNRADCIQVLEAVRAPE